MSRALTRRRIGAGLALLVAIAVVLVLVLGNNSPSAGSTNNAAVDSAGATAVQRRDLVQTDTESGTLSYANPQTVYNRLSGTITWLPQVGQLIKPGQTLYKVDDVPVMLMNGSTPAYRDLSAADSARAGHPGAQPQSGRARVQPRRDRRSTTPGRRPRPTGSMCSRGTWARPRPGI